MPDFGGATFVETRDGERLRLQREKVWAVMCDGRWRTLAEIAALTGAPEASVSARLRDFRKPRHGFHTVERRYIVRGIWQYRVLANEGGSHE